VTALLHPGRRGVVPVFLLALIVFAYFMPQWADWNIDSRIDLVHAVVDNGSLNINHTHWNTWDKAVYKGNFYSDKAPGSAFLGVVAYAGFAAARAVPVLRGGVHFVEKSVAWNTAIRLGFSNTQNQPAPKGYDLGGCQRTGTAGNVQYIPWGNRLVPPFADWALSKYFVTIAVVGLISAAFTAFFFWFLGLFTRRRFVRWLLTGLLAIGTVSLPYSSNFYSHELVAAFLFVAFALLFLYSRQRAGRWALPAAGALLGLSFLTEYTVALVIAIIGLYGLWLLRADARSLGLLCLGGVAPLAALFTYNYICFGSALDTGYTHDFCWTAAQGAGFSGFTYPRLGPLWDLTLGTYRGLFNMSPFLLLAVPGAAFMVRRGFRLEAAVCVVVAATFILAISAYWGWNGGRTDGPRYLVPIVPFVALPVVFWLDGIGRSIPGWALTIAIAGWSLFATWAQFLAGDTFPYSWLRDPLFDYSLPQLAGNHLESNAGLFLGLSGWVSLLPLTVLLALVVAWQVRPSVDARELERRSREPARSEIAAHH
jgi:hypothetical protein